MLTLGLPPTLQRTAWRYAWQHPWQTWLSFLGVALGVMMVIAVDLATSSAQRAFQLSIATVNGNLTHQILGGSSGVPDDIFARLRIELGIRGSAPAANGTVRIQGESFTLLGLDPLSELSLKRQRPGFSGASDAQFGLVVPMLAQKNAVWMSAAAATRLGLQESTIFSIQTASGSVPVSLAGLLPSSTGEGVDQVLFADIATAQVLLHRVGVLDSIDLILSDAEAEKVQAWLPNNLTLAPQHNRYDALQQMTVAFSTNLLAMSLLAMLVAALLIYNAVNLSVVQRHSTLGVLRCLGVSRLELVKLVLLEVTVLGICASTAGLIAGLGLGQLLVKLVTRTIDDLYFNLTVTRFLLSPLVLIKGWGLGVLLTILAGAVPAWRAGLSTPITLQQRSEAALPALKPLLHAALGGVLLLSLGYTLLLPEQGSLVLAFVALTLVVFGGCLFIPLLLQAVLLGMLKLPINWLNHTQRLALANLRTAGHRTALAVAALTVAVSITVGVGVMVGSFRSTVLLWLEQTLAGDLQVASLDLGTAIPAELKTQVQALPHVTQVWQQFRQKAESSAGELTVLASNNPPAKELYLKSATATDLQRVEVGQALLISEPLAWQAHLAIGDSLTLFTNNGPLSLPIAGIFYDYTTTGGIVVLSSPVFHQAWPSVQATRLVIQAQANSDIKALATQLRQLTSRLPGSYGVASNADIRRITLNIFDRTFAITHVLRLLAILVAFVGVLSALLTLQLQRLREYAMLRATGMTVRETALIIVWQTLLMGLLAGLFAIPLGLMMADILIDVINKRSFGWSMQHELSATLLLQALLLAVVAALLAALVPIKRVAAVRPADGMREL